MDRDLIQEQFKLPRTLDLYKEFLGKTEIEVYKEESLQRANELDQKRKNGTRTSITYSAPSD